jgi:16S rRNA processing protein RimM
VFRTAEGTLMAPALKAVFPEVDAEKKTILAVRERLEEVAVRS